MKVSVIVPIYNTKDYIGQCLDSILAQTLEEIEILAVDDGSTDGTTDILKEYAQKHPKKIKAFYKENGGLASARNLALLNATGEYLGFVDSDDWVSATMYEEMYNLAKSEEADIVICDMVDHYKDHDVYHNASTFTDKFKVTPSACNKIFKREFIGDIKFPVGLWYEDFEFTTKNLMLTEKISVIHKDFYHCHCRDVSIMRNNNSKKNMDIITVMDNLVSFTKEKGLTDRYSRTLEYLYIDHILITTINRLEAQDGKEKKAVIKEMRGAVKIRYPKIYSGEVFRQMPKSRQIIAFLNFVGLSSISKIILNVKAKHR